jgi:hypothetical protein
MDFKSFMESADSAKKRAYAAAESKIRKKIAKRKVEGAKAFTQTQKEKMAERGQIAADTISNHGEKNLKKISHTRQQSSLSNLHRPFYTATKGAVKGVVKLAKKVMQRDSDT